MNSTHRIKVFGREILVKSSASAEAVKEIELFVNNEISAVADSVKGGDSQIIIMLALLNIAEIYLMLIRDNEAAQHVSDARISRLLHRIDGLG